MRERNAWEGACFGRTEENESMQREGERENAILGKRRGEEKVRSTVAVAMTDRSETVPRVGLGTLTLAGSCPQVDACQIMR